MSLELPDHKQRSEALDPARSFIVQAPAGSGKTDLLICRFLTLLSRVDQPERILAITFTRKATAEMRKRIVSALALGSDSKTKPYIREPAEQALKRDRELGWNLCDNPGRLRIMTIDALCYELVRSMPWSARFGATPDLLDENGAELLYLEAAQRTLELIEEGSPWAADCAGLLELVGADFNRASSLLATMLPKRERWGRLELDTREQTEAMWRRVIGRHLDQIAGAIPDSIKHELASLARFAAAGLSRQNPEHPLCACQHMESFPHTQFESVAQWLGIASLILTGKGELRKQVNKRLGFPPESPNEKRRIEALLQQIGDIDKDRRPDSRIVNQLVEARQLPVSGITDRRWRILGSLLRILPVAAGQLRLLFKDRNQADFIEIAHRAKSALGQEDDPTDLALVMDYQLSHLLMDEVQDTSRTQIELIRKLTAGWQNGDGRTLFFVGDPMQSIYRFREADVENFTRIQEDGIGDAHLDFLKLETNFRSCQQLVDWFNKTFPQVFPEEPDNLGGGVEYKPCRAAPPDADKPKPPGAIKIHYYADTGSDKTENPAQHEADMICQQVKGTLDRDYNAKIGILGRNRKHLATIAQTLRRHKIPWQAVELESLHERPAIQDLIALTRASSQIADRIAWLAILRAPWCGLNLKDLSVVAMDESCPTIVQACLAQPTVEQMSADGQRRMRRFVAAIQPMVMRHGRVALRDNVEAAWLALGGPVCIEEDDLADCEIWLDLLDTLDSEHTLITPEILSRATERLWSRAGSEAQVELMTMHKSKGLEFDVVILPQLHRQSPRQDKELVRSMRYPDEFLLSGLPDAEEPDPLYDYLGALEEKQRKNDNRRLLYVACTRACRELHLYVRRSFDSKGDAKSPAQSSLLDLLWPTLENRPGEEDTTIPTAIPDNPDESDESTETGRTMFPLTRFKRLPVDWSAPELPANPRLEATAIPHDIEEDHKIEFSWAGEIVRVTGIAIHHMLQEIDDCNWREWKARDTARIVDGARAILLEHGLSGAEFESACNNLKTAVENIKSDARAEWIFSSDHSSVRTEWPLTGIVDRDIVRVVIDRAFIDRSGTRWIIDFKSGWHQGRDKALFLEREKERYSRQMMRYAQIMHNPEANKVMLALYFPLLKGWRQWEA